MTALVKCKSKGVVFSQYVSAAYVAMAGLTSIDISGEKDKTVETVTLDGGQYETNDWTGYTTPPTIKLSGFYDPGHATYTNLASRTNPNNFKVTYTDTAPTSAIYSVVGLGISKKIDPGKPVMADIELVTSGAPS